MTTEKIKAIAKEKYGKELTDAQAAAYIEKHADKIGKLSDDEIDSVSGGYWCGDAEWHYGVFCEPCQVWCDPATLAEGGSGGLTGHSKWKCPVCGTFYS